MFTMHGAIVVINIKFWPRRQKSNDQGVYASDYVYTVTVLREVWLAPNYALVVENDLE